MESVQRSTRPRTLAQSVSVSQRGRTWGLGGASEDSLREILSLPPATQVCGRMPLLFQLSHLWTGDSGAAVPFRKVISQVIVPRKASTILFVLDFVSQSLLFGENKPNCPRQVQVLFALTEKPRGRVMPRGGGGSRN